MQRTYLPWLGLTALAAGASVSLLPQVRAGDLFSSQPLDNSRFAVLAKPVGRSDWTLLVLEQLAPLPRCWESRADGLVAPARTPTAIIERMNREMNALLSSPELEQTLRTDGAIAAPSSPEAFGRLIESEIATWRDVIRRAGITGGN